MEKHNELSTDEFERLSEIYKLFGSVSRLRILFQLSKGEHTAGELCESAQLSASAASHQLKELKQCRIVKARKDGLFVYYSLDDSHIVGMLESGIDHIRHIEGEVNAEEK